MDHRNYVIKYGDRFYSEQDTLNLKESTLSIDDMGHEYYVDKFGDKRRLNK